jgi:hypothetical protein
MKDKLLPVENEDGLYRDCSSGAIINVNSEAYTQYKMQKRLRDDKKFKELMKEHEINTLKCAVAQLEKKFDLLNDKSDKIFNLLEKIVEKNGNS